jgi:hypothetical protein
MLQSERRAEARSSLPGSSLVAHQFQCASAEIVRPLIVIATLRRRMTDEHKPLKRICGAA